MVVSGPAGVGISPHAVIPGSIDNKTNKVKALSFIISPPIDTITETEFPSP
jgi:hypothetical protein